MTFLHPFSRNSKIVIVPSIQQCPSSPETASSSSVSEYANMLASPLTASHQHEIMARIGRDELGYYLVSRSDSTQNGRHTRSSSIVDANELQTLFRANAEEIHAILSRFSGAIQDAIDPDAPFKPKGPAASSAVIQHLPRTRVLPAHRGMFKSDMSSCGICQDRLLDGVSLARLPCGHVYHTHCVVPWLSTTCTCPECRYELETDDAKYEQGRRIRMKARKVVTCTCKFNHHHECFFSTMQKNIEHSSCPTDPIQQHQSTSDQNSSRAIAA